MRLSELVFETPLIDSDAFTVMEGGSGLDKYIRICY